MHDVREGLFGHMPFPEKVALLAGEAHRKRRSTRQSHLKKGVTRSHGSL